MQGTCHQNSILAHIFPVYATQTGCWTFSSRVNLCLIWFYLSTQKTAHVSLTSKELQLFPRGPQMYAAAFKFLYPISGRLLCEFQSQGIILPIWTTQQMPACLQKLNSRWVWWRKSCLQTKCTLIGLKRLPSCWCHSSLQGWDKSRPLVMERRALCMEFLLFYEFSFRAVSDSLRLRFLGMGLHN